MKFDIVETSKGYEAKASWNTLYPTRLSWKEENIPDYKETEEDKKLKDERLYTKCSFVYEKLFGHYLIKRESHGLNYFSPFVENVDLLEPNATEKQAKERCLELLLKEVKP